LTSFVWHWHPRPVCRENGLHRGLLLTQLGGELLGILNGTAHVRALIARKVGRGCGTSEELVDPSTEFAKRTGVHLPHQPAAVGLHRTFRDAEIGGCWCESLGSASKRPTN
jgi:hypothetical protein